MVVKMVRVVPSTKKKIETVQAGASRPRRGRGRGVVPLIQFDLLVHAGRHGPLGRGHPGPSKTGTVAEEG